MRNTFRKVLSAATGAAFALSINVGCGPSPSTAPTSSPTPGAQVPDGNVPQSPGLPVDPPHAPTPGSFQKVKVEEITAIRKVTNNVLDLVAKLPIGSIVAVPTGYEVKHLDFRADDGVVTRSSTGFVTPVIVESVPGWTQAQVTAVNQTTGGLYVTAAIIGAIEGATGSFAAIPATAPQADYLVNYAPNGRPKFDYTTIVAKRFGPRLDKGIPPGDLPPDVREKYRRVYAELVAAANRKVETPRSYLIIDTTLATQLSEKYEQSRYAVPFNGAWSVAVKGTAVRHGFENVPCAEFMSEVIRQAYKRAGFTHLTEFNQAKNTDLIWYKTAAVVTLSQYLYDAGWVPWNSKNYRPPVGAVMMNRSGNSPGHAYMAAGDDGQIIIDNGMPQGRDLRATKKATIELQYMNGVFFLPPGIQPNPW